jgi:hypothetical protein
LKQVLMSSMVTRIIEELGDATSGRCVPPHRAAGGGHFPSPHLNEYALAEILTWFGDFITKVGIFTVVLSDVQHRWADHVQGLGKRFGPEVQIFTGSDAFATMRSHLAQRPGAMMAMQRGSGALTDRLFRSFLINSLVHEGSTTLMVIL